MRSRHARLRNSIKRRKQPLVERHFPAHRPFQNARSDLADGLHRLAIALPVKQLVFRLRHARIGAEVHCKDTVEIKRSQPAGEAGVIPVVAVLLPGRILLGAECIARKRALKRAIPHGDLAAVAAFDVCAGAAQPLRRRQRAPLDQVGHALGWSSRAQAYAAALERMKAALDELCKLWGIGNGGVGFAQ